VTSRLTPIISRCLKATDPAHGLGFHCRGSGTFACSFKEKSLTVALIVSETLDSVFGGNTFICCAAVLLCAHMIVARVAGPVAGSLGGHLPGLLFICSCLA